LASRSTGRNFVAKNTSFTLFGHLTSRHFYRESWSREEKANVLRINAPDLASKDFGVAFANFCKRHDDMLWSLRISLLVTLAPHKLTHSTP
jgi:hypothetical protein